MSQTLKSPWDRVSIAGLASGAAASHGARIFLTDCPDRLIWNGDDARTLSFLEFNRQALFFGAQMMTLGLPPGARLLLMLPNMAELAIAIIGARAAGMVPAIAPVEEGVDALRGAAERIGAQAIVTTARCEDIRLGERARQVAAKLLEIRCVAGFGFGLPDGVVPLDGWAEEDALPLAAPVPVRQDKEAVITFAQADGTLAAYLRSEAQIVADALAFAARARLGREAGVIATLQPGSAAALITGLIVPLFLGMPVQLLGPYRRSRFNAVLARQPEAAIIAPGAIIAALAGEWEEAGGSKPRHSLVSVRRPAEPVVAASGAPVDIPLFDAKEAGLLPLGVWPAEGEAALEGTHMHPMDDILPEDSALISLRNGPDGLSVSGGFCEPRVIQRDTRMVYPGAA